MNTVSARPPSCPKKPHTITAPHGHQREDPYYWLNQRDDQAVLDYLQAENTYCDERMANQQDLKQQLYDEIIARINPDESTPPFYDDGYWWYVRYEKGSDYPLYCRRRKTLEAAEEIYLDVNEVADGHEFCHVTGVDCSDDGRWLCYAVDFTGRRQYELRLRDTSNGEDLAEHISMTAGDDIAWAADNKTLFYLKIDEETLRSHQVWRHQRGNDPADDVMIFEETDDTFGLSVYRSRSKRFVAIASYQSITREFQFLEADQPEDDFRCLFPRERGHEFSIDDHGDYFYILSNRDAINFKLMRCPLNQTAESAWQELIAHDEDVLLDDILTFRDHLVVSERVDGRPTIRIQRWDGSFDRRLTFDQPAHSVWCGQNPSIESSTLRIQYMSLTEPMRIIDVDMDSDERKVLKVFAPRGDFDENEYCSERIEAIASDGERIPVSVVYRKDIDRSQPNPCLLYAYGSYGMSLDPWFSSARLSLLDRGMIWALAHIRGGEEKGRRWYDLGKMEHKMNTFTDFIACAEHLISNGYTDTQHLAIEGGSAGGLLVGAVVNMRPDLFHAVIAEVPFVDVVTTMLDDSIPLTTGEYDEWGNPNEPDAYQRMLAYSPYDNVSAQDYPQMLVTTGLYDSQVQYWEPAKWVARLREIKTDDNELLLHCDMGSGHGGKSGRYQHHQDTALRYTWLLSRLPDIALS